MRTGKVPRLAGLEAVTLDFGNTLVPVRHADVQVAITRTADQIILRSGPFTRESFLTAWSEERDRQFAEEVPAFREVDLRQRMRRVLARLRGMSVPDRGAQWDDRLAAERSDSAEIEDGVAIYSRAFVESIPVPAEVGPLLGRLSERYVLAILSNWPLAATIDAYIEACGWGVHLAAVIVSERIGTIKPHQRIFDATEGALGVRGPAILHVGDDWQADIVGAARAGWRTAYLVGPREASPLPASEPDDSVVADFVIHRLEELERLLG